MRELYEFFQAVGDPRHSNVTRHDLHEMPMIGLLSMLTGGRTCVNMTAFGRAWEPRLRKCMKHGHGIASHDAFTDLFRSLAPSGLVTALLRMAQDRGDAPGDVVAVDGKALRRSFEDATERSALHLAQAFAAEAKLTPDGRLPSARRRADDRGRVRSRIHPGRTWGRRADEP